MCGVGNVSQQQPVRSVTSPESPNSPANVAKAQQLFSQDVLSKSGGTACARSQPAMPAAVNNGFGHDLDGLMASLGLDKKKTGGADFGKSNVQSVNSAAASDTAVNASAGSSSDASGGSNPLSGMMNQLMQGVMGMLKNFVGGL